MANSKNYGPDGRVVYLLATLDTKGTEAAFLRDRLLALGIPVRLVDTGCLGEPTVMADIARDQLFASAGVSPADVRARGDRGEAVGLAARGAAKLVADAYGQGQLAGVLGMGGSAGTTIGAAAMQALPLGVPKVMVSTHASGNTRSYVGHKDIVMINPIVDISGLNRISRLVLSQAAAAVAGLVRFSDASGSSESRPIVAATMFGVTTPCVERARAILEQAGYEVLVFHATGSGGEAMESLIAEGLIAGVLDITTTELADELCGGFLSAGPDRLTAAGRMAIPQVISVGATDMVNFHGLDTVPPQHRGRTLYKHNEHVTLMRTTADENARIGAAIGIRASQTRGPVAVFLPAGGVSAIDRAGQPFDDPAARASLFEAIRGNLTAGELVEMPQHINDAEFAAAAAHKLISFLQATGR